MTRKFAYGFALLILTLALSGASFANAIQITLGQNTAGTASAGTTGASFTGVSGYAYQGANAGTYSLSDASYSGTGCGVMCTLTGGPQTVTVTIGSDTLVGTLNLTTEYGSAALFGSVAITSSTPGFASTGYAAGQTVGADVVVVGGHVSSGQIETDSPVPEPGSLTLIGSGLLAAAGMLRRKF